MAKSSSRNFIAFALLNGALLTGCTLLPWGSDPETQETGAVQVAQDPPVVDVVIAEMSILRESPSYIGTTQPFQTVAVSAREEGRLLSLTVDIGDSVLAGQKIGELDDTLLTASVNEAQAQVASLKAEVAQARAQLNQVKIQAEQAKIELEQARNDASRYADLAEVGGVSQQQADSFATAAAVAEKNVLATTEQISIQEQAVAAARARVGVQQAILAQTLERQGFTDLIAPVTGIVTEKNFAPGDLITPGTEVVRIGDFSQIKVVVPLSELDLSAIALNQAVTVRLDAFPDEQFSGQLQRIAPQANPETRQVPVEVVLPNPGVLIGGGLLARIQFANTRLPQVTIPESAIQSVEGQTVVFVPTDNSNSPTIRKQLVQVSDRFNGQAQITRGLQAGEQYIIRTNRRLKDGQAVRLSILSDTDG
ncbi:MAG: efflux RND transporter periplasmic adaptor subunit [Cyanobacteria bacterium P01_H01_bin.15]